jgi:hypothetical protein
MRSLLLFAVAALVLVSVVSGQTPVPVINTVDPNSIPAGNPDFAITVSGSNFISASLIQFGGAVLNTTFVSNNQLTASVSADLVAIAGNVTITVTNGGILSNFFTFQVTAGPVSITTSSLPDGAVGQSYNSTLNATGGTPPYIWTSTGTLPPGLSLSSGGILSGIPTTPGVYTFTAKATDSQLFSASAKLTVNIVAQPLSIVTPSLPGGLVGQTYSQQLAATGGTLPYTWSSGNLPPGLTLSTAGVLSGTPTTAGTYTLSLQVKDGSSATATKSLSLTITAPLTITTDPALFPAFVNLPYSQQFTASGGTGSYTWTLTSGSIPGLTLTTNGTLQGTPQTAGSYPFTVTVTDQASQTASKGYTLTVKPAALTITTPSPLPGGAVGTPYNQQFAVTGGTAPYTWATPTGALPDGLTFDTTQAILSGTPAKTGTFTFTLQVTDSLGAAGAKTFQITISAAQLQIVTAPQLPDGVLGTPYSVTMSATGGTPPYNWSANFPPGMGLSINPTTGTISGTLGLAGSRTFPVTVRDSAQVSKSDNFTINVLPPALPPVTISGMPASSTPLQQFPLTVNLGTAYAVDVTVTVTLSSIPDDNGPVDGGIQFASGGQRATTTIGAGTVVSPQLMIQTGTVAGKITATVTQVTAGGFDLTPTPPVTASTQIARSAPVISKATVSRSGSTLTVQVTGYATSREITQAVFTFTAASGQSLATSSFTVPLDSIFTPYYQNAANAAYGSQFVYSQPFTIQGDANSVIPQNVTLTNRAGTTTAPVQ